MTSIAEGPGTTAEAWQARGVVRVALAGCGVVGSALLREFVTRRDSLADRLGVELVLASVLVRDVERPRDAAFDRKVLTCDVEEFLAADTDVVIEAIGGLDPALSIARATLSRGRKLVTANKALLARHGSELVALARQNGTTLRYDAAVGGFRALAAELSIWLLIGSALVRREDGKAANRSILVGPDGARVNGQGLRANGGMI